MNIATANADTVSTTGIHRIRAAHAWLDVVVVVAVLVSTNLVAHFTTVWASIATVPIAAVVLVGLTRRRGLGWAELGLSPRHWRKGTVYALACVGLVLAVVAVGIALPFTRQFFMADRYATVSGALIASMIVIPLQTVIPEELAFRGVLQGTLSRVSGARGVFAAGSLLFGLWHIASSLGLTTGNRGLTGILGGGLMGRSSASPARSLPPPRPDSSSHGSVVAVAACSPRSRCTGRSTASAHSLPLSSGTPPWPDPALVSTARSALAERAVRCLCHQSCRQSGLFVSFPIMSDM